jgi:HAD superfamily hydrolase (TIGR01662 family)
VVKAPVAGLGDLGPAAAARPNKVHANTLLAGWTTSMCAPRSKQLRPGILLDRDGTIIVDHGYVGSVDRVEFIEGAPEAVARFNRASLPVAVVANQAGVARGLYGIDDVARVHQHIQARLAEHGAHIDLFLVLPVPSRGNRRGLRSYKREPQAETRHGERSG